MSPKTMTAAEYRAAVGAEPVLEARPATPGEQRQMDLRIVTVSEANSRDHWAKQATRKKRQRNALRAAWLGHCWPIGSKPVRVTFTRLAARTLDTDNLASAFKAMRDEVAKLCGCDDGKGGPEWQYEQETQRKEPAVRLTVEWGLV